MEPYAARTSRRPRPPRVDTACAAMGLAPSRWPETGQPGAETAAPRLRPVRQPRECSPAPEEWPAIDRKPGPGGALAGVRRPDRMPCVRLLPAGPEATVRAPFQAVRPARHRDRKSTRLNSSHL